MGGTLGFCYEKSDITYFTAQWNFRVVSPLIGTSQECRRRRHLEVKLVMIATWVWCFTRERPFMSKRPLHLMMAPGVRPYSFNVGSVAHP